jgi:ribonuclease HII
MTYEQDFINQGKTIIAGVDEAGYGAWAGPVAAGAVCLPLDDPHLAERLRGVKDSKQMTPRQRENAFDVIKSVALGWSVKYSTPEEVSTHGLAVALGMAFTRAYEECAAMMDELPVEVLMIDGKSTWKSCPYEQAGGGVIVERVPNGDALSLTIAAASVLAKVTRDDYMRQLAEQHPGYGFERHKGYGTAAHSTALDAHGVLPGIHRTNYAPIARRL